MEANATRKAQETFEEARAQAVRAAVAAGVELAERADAFGRAQLGHAAAATREATDLFVYAAEAGLRVQAAAREAGAQLVSGLAGR